MDAKTYNLQQFDHGKYSRDQLAFLIEKGTIEFQADHGLFVDGKAGPKTRKMINKALAPKKRHPGLPTGKGMFIRSLRHCGTEEEMIKKCNWADLSWLCFQRIWQYEDESKPSSWYNTSRMIPYSQAMHDNNIGVWIWGFPGTTPDQQKEFIEAMFTAVDKIKAVGVILDPESPWLGVHHDVAELFMQNFMAEANKRNTCVGVSSYGAPWNIPSFPWRGFSRDAHFGCPQIYNVSRSLGKKFPAKSVQRYQDLGFPFIVPASGAYGGTGAEMTGLLNDTPMPEGAVLWWDWVNASNGDKKGKERWKAIAGFQI